MKKLWNVYHLLHVGDQQIGTYLCSVETDSASDATAIASAGTMTSRLSLVAYPDEIDNRKGNWPEWAPRLISLDGRKPGRPKELQGEYELVSVKIRKDLLAKIGASGKSRREFIEALLEQ